jgi:hypothetical protein
MKKINYYIYVTYREEDTFKLAMFKFDTPLPRKKELTELAESVLNEMRNLGHNLIRAMYVPNRDVLVTTQDGEKEYVQLMDIPKIKCLWVANGYEYINSKITYENAYAVLLWGIAPISVDFVLQEESNDENLSEGRV